MADKLKIQKYPFQTLKFHFERIKNTDTHKPCTQYERLK